MTSPSQIIKKKKMLSLNCVIFINTVNTFFYITDTGVTIGRNPLVLL